MSADDLRSDRDSSDNYLFRRNVALTQSSRQGRTAIDEENDGCAPSPAEAPQSGDLIGVSVSLGEYFDTLSLFLVVSRLAAMQARK